MNLNQNGTTFLIGFITVDQEMGLRWNYVARDDHTLLSQTHISVYHEQEEGVVYQFRYSQTI